MWGGLPIGLVELQRLGGLSCDFSTLSLTAGVVNLRRVANSRLDADWQSAAR
jgi:hypothetical protein